MARLGDFLWEQCYDSIFAWMVSRKETDSPFTAMAQNHPDIGMVEIYDVVVPGETEGKWWRK
jgi:uncharacterized Fe-S radical SAM superfamily protein PflX